MSEASGLWRVPRERRDLLAASSFGTGELLLAAGRAHAQKIIIGLGGSATNDGGFGMARALGFRFVDREGQELKRRVSELVRLAHAETPDALELPAIVAAADVRNPLLGPRGATRVFGPQKGATADELEVLESALARLAEVVARDLNVDFRNAAGGGAAGGLGYGLLTFCGASIQPGFDVVAGAVGLEEAVRNADIVITGEGCLDEQTLEGKAPAGVARLARKCRKSVYAIAGELNATAEVVALFDGIATLVAPSVTIAEAISNAPQLLRDRGRELALRFAR
jgi:glycerate kinase